jgi:hypothetical protein
MFLVIVTVSLCLSVVFFYLALLGSRVQKQTILTGDMAIGSVYVPAVIGFGALGLTVIARLFQSPGGFALNVGHIALSMGIAAGAVILAVLMHRKLNKLQDLAEPSVIMQIVQTAGHGDEPDEGKAA